MGGSSMEKEKKNKKKIIVLVISAVILLAVLAVMTVQSRQPVSAPEEMTEEYATVEEAGGAKPEAGQTVGTKTAEKSTSEETTEKDKTDGLKSDPDTTQTPATTQATASANTKPQTTPAATTEAPKKPGTTQQATTEKPKTTEVPATTEKPKTTEAPATTEAPKKPTTEAPATTEAPKKSQTTQAPATTEAQKKQVWVVDQAAYDEEVPVYETRCRWICTGCGGYMYSQADIDDHPCIASWYSDIYDVQVGTKTVHHDEVGHWEWK